MQKWQINSVVQNEFCIKVHFYQRKGFQSVQAENVQHNLLNVKRGVKILLILHSGL